jgi:hypothetical protein
MTERITCDKNVMTEGITCDKNVMTEGIITGLSLRQTEHIFETNIS